MIPLQLTEEKLQNEVRGLVQKTVLLNGVNKVLPRRGASFVDLFTSRKSE